MAGGPALDWILVQPEVAKFTRVCSYDRPGYGWSDASPAPRTSWQIAGELKSLLDAAGEKSPFVMVGHSFGGYNVACSRPAIPRTWPAWCWSMPVIPMRVAAPTRSSPPLNSQRNSRTSGATRRGIRSPSRWPSISAFGERPWPWEGSLPATSRGGSRRNSCIWSACPSSSAPSRRKTPCSRSAVPRQLPRGLWATGP